MVVINIHDEVKSIFIHQIRVGPSLNLNDRQNKKEAHHKDNNYLDGLLAQHFRDFGFLGQFFLTTCVRIIQHILFLLQLLQLLANVIFDLI